MSKHSFSIENLVNPLTKQPFGAQYAGNFTIRRPTLADRNAIALRDMAGLSTYGVVDVRFVDSDVINTNYVFAHLNTIADEKPEWCDLNKLYTDDDESAILNGVWPEVKKFLDSFRPANASGDGEPGSK